MKDATRIPKKKEKEAKGEQKIEVFSDERRGTRAEISLWKLGVENISEIELLKERQDFDGLSIGDIKKIDGLENLSNLKGLILSGTFEKIQGLDALENLEFLGINGQFRKIEGLDALENLISLDISGRFEKIEGLENLTHLERLIIGGRLETLESMLNVYPLKKLTELEIKTRRLLKKIEHLDGLTNLTRLVLRRNNIEEISGLDNFVNLESLDLSHNEITEIKGLSNLKKLWSLNLESNKITEVKGLQGLNLTFLNLRNNPLKGWEPRVYHVYEDDDYEHNIKRDRILLNRFTADKIEYSRYDKPGWWKDL